jgi:hypothetical protein
VVLGAESWPLREPRVGSSTIVRFETEEGFWRANGLGGLPRSKTLASRRLARLYGSRCPGDGRGHDPAHSALDEDRMGNFQPAKDAKGNQGARGSGAEAPQPSADDALAKLDRLISAPQPVRPAARAAQPDAGSLRPPTRVDRAQTAPAVDRDTPSHGPVRADETTATHPRSWARRALAIVVVGAAVIGLLFALEGRMSGLLTKPFVLANLGPTTAPDEVTGNPAATPASSAAAAPEASPAGETPKPAASSASRTANPPAGAAQPPTSKVESPTKPAARASARAAAADSRATAPSSDEEKPSESRRHKKHAKHEKEAKSPGAARARWRSNSSPGRFTLFSAFGDSVRGKAPSR